MPSLAEMEMSLDKVETLTLEALHQVDYVREMRDPKQRAAMLMRLQAKLLEAARVVPFDVKLH